MPTHELQAYSYEDRNGLLSSLSSALTRCGGWVLERKAISATTMEFRLELQLDSIVELYSALMASGVELTRSTHATLTGLCTSRRFISGWSHSNQIVCMRLELSFLDDVTLHSLLMTGSGEA